jgi:hypothetical protein
LRSGFGTDIAVPFTPSAGVEARLLQLKNSRMHVRYNILAQL